MPFYLKQPVFDTACPAKLDKLCFAKTIVLNMWVCPHKDAGDIIILLSSLDLEKICFIALCAT